MASQAVRVVAASGSPFLKPVTSGDRLFDPAGGLMPQNNRRFGAAPGFRRAVLDDGYIGMAATCPATLSRTPPLPGVGSGTSLRVGKVLNCSKTTAFISSLSSLKHFRSYAQGGECAHQHRCNKNPAERQLSLIPKECDMSHNVGLVVSTERMKKFTYI